MDKASIQTAPIVDDRNTQFDLSFADLATMMIPPKLTADNIKEMSKIPMDKTSIQTAPIVDYKNTQFDLSFADLARMMIPPKLTTDNRETMSTGRHLDDASMQTTTTVDASVQTATTIDENINFNLSIRSGSNQDSHEQ
jgi:hypothetical protein